MKEMKRSALVLIIIFNAFAAYCQLNLPSEKHYELKNFNDIIPDGKMYSSSIIMEKIIGMKKDIDIDTTEWGEGLSFYWLTAYLQGLDDVDYAAMDSSFYTYPEDYVFLDINNDGIEDMVFQSRGPFVSDSRCFAIFLSNDIQKTHDVIWCNGVLTEISDYSLSLPNYSGDYKGLMINYVQYGCCALSGWDKLKTDFLFFENPPAGLKNPVSLRIINRNTLDY